MAITFKEVKHKLKKCSRKQKIRDYQPYFKNNQIKFMEL